MSNKLMALDIQRFAEGAGAAETGAAISQPQTSGEINGADTQTAAVSDAGGQKSQAAHPQSPDGDSSPSKGSLDNEGNAVTLDSIFEKYPELKKEADKRTQKAVQGRVHQINKSMQSSNNIIDKLMVLHGVKTVDELNEKLDKTLPEEFAAQNGLSNDMGSEMLNMRVKSMQDDRMREYYAQQQKAERQLRQWEQEAEQVKSVYADFDLNTELQNPDFRRLISAVDPQYRMPMKQIYEMLHHDEFVEKAKADTAAAYAKSVAANAARPPENGLGNQAAVSGNKDVSKLTKKERAELAKRAQRGEKITFN